VHYHFISKRRFESMRDSMTCSNTRGCTATTMGTPREEVGQTLTAGRDMLFDIDCRDAAALPAKMRSEW